MAILVTASYRNLALASEYSEQVPKYKELCEEVDRILKSVLRLKAIEVSQVTHRVKQFESFQEKALRKNYSNPLFETKDIAGARVVCLYADDIPKIVKLIALNFDVRESVSKAIQDVDRFGYAAHHCVVRLRPKVSGSRYNDLKDRDCEIQVRTVMQDAWAIIDHHLRYKHESQIPSALAHSIHGLAAVIELTDKQFNSILNERDSYVKRLRDKRRSLRSLIGEELNRESLEAYLLKRFPKLDLARIPDHMDVAVEYLDFQKYKTVAAIDEILAKTEKARGDYSRRDDYGGKFSLSQLAIALGCVDNDYFENTFFGDTARKVIKKYRSQQQAKQKSKSAKRRTQSRRKRASTHAAKLDQRSRKRVVTVRGAPAAFRWDRIHRENLNKVAERSTPRYTAAKGAGRVR